MVVHRVGPALYQSSSGAWSAGTLLLGGSAGPREAAWLHELRWCAGGMLELGHAAESRAVASLELWGALWGPAHITIFAARQQSCSMQIKMAIASKDGSCTCRCLLTNQNDEFKAFVGMFSCFHMGTELACTRHESRNSKTYLLQTDSYEVLELMTERTFKLRSR